MAGRNIGKDLDGVAAGDAERGTRGKVLYGLSLPERALRSAAGVVGGTLRESASVLLPDAFRNAKTYQVFIGQMLDFMAEDFGRVGESRPSAGSRRDDNGPDDVGRDGYIARKTVGNFVEVASLATVHLSPMLVLAVVSDVAYGSQAYLRELADEMQRQGVIEDATRIRQVDDLLDQVADVSGKTATAFDTPPLSVAGLKETVRQTRASLSTIDPSKVLPERDLAKLWNDMQASARQQGVSPFKLSGLMTLGALDKIGKVGGGALSSAQAVGTLVDRHVLNHYRVVLADIDAKGFYPSLAAMSNPYLQAASQNFSRERFTVTEAFLAGGAERAWDRARGWLKPRRRGT